MRFVFLSIISSLFLFNGNAQVNIQNGTPQQSFPLISYVDGKAGLSMGINLNYVGGNGLVVNDVASNMGTGWNLDAGGFVTRIQNGEPDDQIAYGTGSFYADKDDDLGVAQVLKNYPNGYLFNPNAASGCNVGLNYYTVFKKQSVYKELNAVGSDMEQDKFVFKVNGRSGSFVIGKNQQVTTLGDSKIKVSFTMSDMTSQGIRTRINQFTIITEDGIKYTFQELGLTHLCRYKYSRLNESGQWEVRSGSPDDDSYAVNRFWGYKLASNERPYIVSTWFLTSIQNPNTGQGITFSYQNVNNDFVSALSVNHARNLNRGKPGKKKFVESGRKRFKQLTDPAVANHYSWDENALNEFEAGPTTLFYNRSVSLTKRLSGIILPNGGYIALTYAAMERADLKGENALDKIIYSIRGKNVRSFQFNFGYFFKNSIRPYNYSFAGYDAKFARLCLLGIQKLGNAEDDATEPPYQFSYYTGSTQSEDDIVPARNFLAQDHWGYYNGSVSQLPLKEDHDFLSSEEISYFRTVLAKFKNSKSGYAKNGLLKTITYPTGGSVTYTYEQNKPSSNILPNQYEQLAGGVSVTKTTTFDGEDHAKDIIAEYVYKNLSNQSSRWGDESPEYYSLSVTEYNRKWLGKVLWTKVGLNYPEAAVSPDILKMVLKMELMNQIGIAMNGLIAIMPPPVNTIAQLVVMAVQLIKMISDNTQTIEYHKYTLSNRNNILANALPGFYSIVQVKNNSPNGYNGKVVYEFTSLADYPALVPQFRWPYIPNQRIASWVYGLPKKLTIYDKDDHIVKESDNYYNYIVSKKSEINNLNCKCATANKRDIKQNEWESEAYFTWAQKHWMIPQPYFVYTGRSDLRSSISKDYTNGQMYHRSGTNTIIDPMTLLQKGKVIQRDGNSVILELTYYPTDYNISGSAMEKMIQLNAIHTPIATETWLVKGWELFLLDATVTQYNVFTFGSRLEVKPATVWRLKSKVPVPMNAIGTHNRSQLIRQSSYFHQSAVMTYDDDGNLVQTDIEQNPTSFINDYKNRSVVASVANAAFSDISYSSFEADGKGGWTYDTLFIKITGGITGSKSIKVGFDAELNQTSTITRTGLDANKTYVITYWLKELENDHAYVNSQEGELQYTQFSTGWRLFKHEITGVTQVTITGNSTMDELRLYPKGALMSTVTFNEGIGKSSECDANNRLLYYEYDALGRVKLVRDQNRNIIKTYEYNYKRL